MLFMSTLQLTPCFYFIDTCLKKDCKFYSMCLPRSDGTAQCICPSCEKSFAPVCDDNEETHASECYMKRYACQNNQNAKVTSQGACSTCHLCFK